MELHIFKLFLRVGAAFLVLCIISCRQSSDNQHTHHQMDSHQEEERDPQSHGHGSHGHENILEDELQLNDGVKWEADEPTNRNAEKIIAIGDQFMATDNRSLQDYQTFGQDVQDAINTMIRECTMEGAADQALHIWFLPLLENSGKLINATDTGELPTIVDHMVERMRMYPGYFE